MGKKGKISGKKGRRDGNPFPAFGNARNAGIPGEAAFGGTEGQEDGAGSSGLSEPVQGPRAPRGHTLGIRLRNSRNRPENSWEKNGKIRENTGKKLREHRENAGDKARECRDRDLDPAPIPLPDPDFPKFPCPGLENFRKMLGKCRE